MRDKKDGLVDSLLNTPENFEKSVERAIQSLRALKFGDNFIVAAGKLPAGVDFGKDEGKKVPYETAIAVSCGQPFAVGVIDALMKNQDITPLHMIAYKLAEMKSDSERHAGGQAEEGGKVYHAKEGQ